MLKQLLIPKNSSREKFEVKMDNLHHQMFQNFIQFQYASATMRQKYATVLAILLWIFLEKKIKKIKYLEKLSSTLKKYSVVVKETNKEENAKKRSFPS